jgi:amidase
MPTVAFRAPPLPPPDCAIEESVAAAANMASNTCQANLTGHPSMSLPCARAEDLPIGMMITGRQFDDFSVIAAAAAFESLGDWRAM